MLRLPVDHPDRFILADEVHARPPESIETPARASYVAVLIDPDERDRERAHLATLFERFNAAQPAANAIHFSGKLGGIRLKWERHGEFSSYMFFAAHKNGQPFEEPVTDLLPKDWLAGLPGRTMVAAHLSLQAWPPDAVAQAPDSADVAKHFSGNLMVGAQIAEGAGVAYTDFRIHDDGCSRFLLYNRSFTPWQAGRIMQWLCEIEAYRMMALLALPIARRQSPRIQAIERSLAAFTDEIARDDGRGTGDEALLHELTRLAAEVESGLAASQFRFGASRAYYELVTTRIAELREQRLPGAQTIGEFMTRRLTPAVATCATVSQRLHDLSERVAQASGLLSTRVDIARERQNQALLASMDRRAKLQLRLQQTVEGLSVAAIVYYVIGLVGYAAKAVKAAGVRVEPDLVMGLMIPVVAGLVIISVRRARRRIIQGETAVGTSDTKQKGL